MATANLRWHQDRVIARLTGVMLQRAARSANALERTLKARVGTRYPPASLPGQPPHRRTGALQRSIRVVARSLGRRISVVATVAAPYAKFLQRGTRRMVRRPFLGFQIDARLVVDYLSGRRR